MDFFNKIFDFKLEKLLLFMLIWMLLNKFNKEYYRTIKKEKKVKKNKKIESSYYLSH